MHRKLLTLAMLLCALAYAQGGATWKKVVDTAKAYEIQPMERPEWAVRKDAPLFQVVWYSDQHVRHRESINVNRIALNLARDTIKPDFAIITGDNNTFHPQLSERDRDTPGYQAKTHAWFKEFLEKELAIPYHIIPGDNWPLDFEKVFGATHYSYDYCGFHFQFAALDIIAPDTNGCATFSKPALSWMQKDLQDSADKPTLFILHETIWPPCFLDATKCNALFKRNPNVIAALGGHLHLDLQFERGSWVQLVGPSVGLSHRPGFKVLRFHPDIIIIESWEWNEETRTFEQASKWQKIDVPEMLRPEPGIPKSEQNYRQMPPAAKVIDTSLAKRYKEVTNNFLGFLLSFGMQRMLQPPAAEKTP